MEKHIASNTLWLLFSQSLSKLFAFFYTIFLAKNLGVNSYGIYILALSYYGVISTLGDFGINRYLTREIAKDLNKLPSLVITTIIIRLGLTTVVNILLILSLLLFEVDLARRNIIIIILLAVFPQSISVTLDSTFVALSKIKVSAFASLMLNLVTMIIGSWLVIHGWGIVGAAYALVFGQLVYVSILILLTLSRRLKVFESFSINLGIDIFMKSLPYGILALIGFVSFKLDTFFLAYFKGVVEVGFYGAAYRFLEAIAFIPSAVATVLFPILSKLHEGDIIKLKRTYLNNSIFMFLLGVCVSIGFIFILPYIIRYFLPSYLNSVSIIQVLSLSIPFIFVHILSGQVLLSTNRYLKQLIILYLILLCVNAILYLSFIPKYGYMGAAWVTVISEIMTFISFTWFIRNKILKS